ncbi:MAG: DMT family transporter [Clostridia bacterium]|nr:DMT family transporter [Clostridia bacterium]MBQ9919246.1 DMT family transporter [Clostridia bacterium]
MNSKSNIKGSLMLLLAAFIWGSTFVAQSEAQTEPFTYIACRNFIGTLVLLPVIAAIDVFSKKKGLLPKDFKVLSFSKKEITGGIICGCVLFTAASLQQYGIFLYPADGAAAGKSGFITALYIVLVPIAGLFLKKKAGINIWVSVAIATVGMYLLCVKNGFEVHYADLILFVCAIGFTAHILVIDRFIPFVNGVKLSALQFLVAGILGLIFMFAFESPSITVILKDAIPILYAGLLSSGVAYTLQIVAQKETNPTVASVVMSLESVFAVLSGALFGEVMSGREIVGCVLMFIAVILAQIEFKPLKVK